MQSLGQRIYRGKLAKLLSMTSLQDVMGMTWCAWAIQNGHADVARQYMHFPADATDGAPGARYGIYPWQLETLVNEAIVAPRRPDARQRQLVTSEFATVFQLVKLVQRIEEADDRHFLSDHDVLYELHRLTQRQFEWQRGFLNQPRYYRALALYGEGATGRYFEDQVGCAVADFIQAAFYLFCGSSNSASRIWRNYGGNAGVSEELRSRVLNRISLDPKSARAEATKLRRDGEHIGYKPSVLRRHPMLRFDENAMAPVPPLIMQRATSGLYFDIVGGGGTVWDEVGRRFETYCQRYLDAMLDGYDVAPEIRYGSKNKGFATPDLLISKGKTIRLVIECKAKRMPVGARFSGDPVSDATSAYDEIAKGVFQVWRFYSHARRGLFDLPVGSDCLGLVLTVDPWLVMGQKLHPEVMAIANRIADEKDPQIEEQDRRRVPVVLIDDLEYALQHGSIEGFFKRLGDLTEDQTGWKWSLSPASGEEAVRPYPFTDELRARLPFIFPSGKTD